MIATGHTGFLSRVKGMMENGYGMAPPQDQSPKKPDQSPKKTESTPAKRKLTYKDDKTKSPNPLSHAIEKDGGFSDQTGL